ncbi:hypothetical protein DM163_25220 [Escherichia coli]|nr:hypothetical protein [Escherichia coli]KUT14979.1 hypothetical protein AWE81_26280 [Escherichia coli]MJE63982.1 hypothetical protein [Escherichia coli]
MNRNLTLNERLKQQAELELQEIEEVHKEALRNIVRELRRIAQTEKNTISKDIEELKENLKTETEEKLKELTDLMREPIKEELGEQKKLLEQLKTQITAANLIRPVWILVAITILLFIFGYLTKIWQVYQIEENQKEIAQQEETLSKLNAKTWGITYQEYKEGRFLLLPKGSTVETKWKIDGHPAIKIIEE